MSKRLSIIFFSFSFFQAWVQYCIASTLIIWKKIITVIDATFAVAKRKPEKIQACTRFKPLTSAILEQWSTNRAKKPTGNRSLNWIVVINQLVLQFCSGNQAVNILNFTSVGQGSTKKPGGTPYNDLYGEAPPERGTFFRPQVYERVGISLVEVYGKVRKSFILVFEKALGLTDALLFFFVGGRGGVTPTMD